MVVTRNKENTRIGTSGILRKDRRENDKYETMYFELKYMQYINMWVLLPKINATISNVQNVEIQINMGLNHEFFKI
jgi:hypothetical protein